MPYCRVSEKVIDSLDWNGFPPLCRGTFFKVVFSPKSSGGFSFYFEGPWVDLCSLDAALVFASFGKTTQYVSEVVGSYLAREVQYSRKVSRR